SSPGSPQQAEPTCPELSGNGQPGRRRPHAGPGGTPAITPCPCVAARTNERDRTLTRPTPARSRRRLAALLTALIMIGAAAVVAPPATGATDPPTPAADTSAYNPWLVIEPSSIAQWDL